jgi:predicted RNA-binding protein with PUA-like domain
LTEKNYWIFKNEVSDYSIDQMKNDKRTLWTGVRNYQARNFMMQNMQVGDLGYFYHSNAEPSGAAGIIRICNKAVVDSTALDKKSRYYDPKATIDKPIWFCVEVEFVEKLQRIVSIQEMRNHSALKNLMILQKGSRLSITPLSKVEFDFIYKLSTN